MSHRRFNNEIQLNKENSTNFNNILSSRDTKSTFSSASPNTFLSGNANENVNAFKNTIKNENSYQSQLVKDITNSTPAFNTLEKNKATNQFSHYSTDEFAIEYMPPSIDNFNPPAFNFPIDEDIIVPSTNTSDFSPINQAHLNLSLDDIIPLDDAKIDSVFIDSPSLSDSQPFSTSNLVSNHHGISAGIDIVNSSIRQLSVSSFNRKFKCRIPRPIGKQIHPRRHRRTLVPNEFLAQ